MADGQGADPPPDGTTDTGTARPAPGSPARAGDGPQRDEGGPQRDEGGPQRDEDGPQRDEDGPQRDEDIVDELPEDLDLAGFVGPYTFPNNNRRRIPATIYLVMGGASVLAYALARDTSALVNAGTLWGGVGLVAFGAYGLVAGWTLRVEESDALSTASDRVGFAVGHASAQMAWRGWLSRPVWRILCYSAETPPKRRGIVLVDGVDGDVLEWFAEDNPEDWSELDGSLSA